MSTPYQRAQGRSAVYEYLSAAFLYPTGQTLELLIQNGDKVAEILGHLGASEGATTLEQAYLALVETDLTQATDQYIRVFGHTLSKDCPPYEGAYGHGDIFQMSQVLADLGGFYRAFGLDLVPEAAERLDHISVELEFMHVLTLKEAYALRLSHEQKKIALCQDAQRAFLEQHLGTWAGGFARRLKRQASEGFYYHLGESLDTYVRSEMEQLGITPQLIPSAAPPLPAEELDSYQCPLAS